MRLLLGETPTLSPGAEGAKSQLAVQEASSEEPEPQYGSAGRQPRAWAAIGTRLGQAPVSGAGGLYLTQGRDISPAVPLLLVAGDFRKLSALTRVRIAVLALG